jgi:putative aminopeptidase FrvX
MRAESMEFLKVLVKTPSPSGYEQKTAAVFRRYVGSFADETKTDVMGNTMGILNKGGSPRVMLAGHIDEIGFIKRIYSAVKQSTDTKH